MSVYKIFDENGNVINRIVADQEFVDKHYSGRYELEEQPDEPETEQGGL